MLGEGSQHWPPLTDLALELASLATLVRAMDCYYSNLIEGHDTHPVDIERALQGDYRGDRRKRDLQLDARAHVDVQQWIDEGGLQARAVTADAIREIHRRFCAALPEDLRTRDVMVGGHIAISAPAVPRFLARFEEGYARLGTGSALRATTGFTCGHPGRPCTARRPLTEMTARDFEPWTRMRVGG